MPCSGKTTPSTSPQLSLLLESKYKTLWGLVPADADQDDETADLILQLVKKLTAIYREKIKTVNGKRLTRPFKPSDILLTKILLGTIGCTPACDNLFINGLRRKKQPFSGFKKAFLKRAFCFYRDHNSQFERAARSIAKHSKLKYPPMKLLDMYFWQNGLADRSPVP